MRQPIVLAVLLTAALVGSYVSWTTADDTSKADEDKIAMYRASAGDVSKIVWKSEDSEIVVEKKSDAKGEYSWLTVTEQVAKPTPPPPPKAADDTDAAQEPEPPVEKETKVTSFLGNDKATKLWEQFSPLMALRELETTDGTKSAAFGLDEPKGTLVVTRGSEELTMPVGGETWGSGNRYVGLNGKVYLVDKAALRSLQFGKNQLNERKIQPIGEADLDSITVTRNGKTVTFLQKNREDRAKAFWTRDPAADANDPVAATWVDKVLKVTLQEYAPPGAELQLEPQFDFVAASKDQSWKVEILKDSASSDFYARSEYTRGLVKLVRTLSADAVADVDGAMDGSGPAEPPPPEKPPALVPSEE